MNDNSQPTSFQSPFQLSIARTPLTMHFQLFFPEEMLCLLSCPFHFLLISFSYPLHFLSCSFIYFSCPFYFSTWKGGRGGYSSKVDITKTQHGPIGFHYFLTTSDILVAVIEPLPVQSPHRPLVTHLHHPAVSLSLFSQVLLLSPGLRTVPSVLAEGRPQTMWDGCTANHPSEN